MFEIGRSFHKEISGKAEPDSSQIHARRYQKAVGRFKSVLLQGQLAWLKKNLLHVRCSLYDLDLLKPDLNLGGCSYSGVKAVEISRIIGTEGRASDFDMDFHPVSEKSRERWVNMAMASQNNMPLKPVELIQIGDVYFVRDGHHRISVARAFGQVAVDAEVIRWKAQSPFPWETNESIATGREHVQRSRDSSHNPSGACCV